MDLSLEDARIAELQRYEILDSTPEPTFDRIVQILLGTFGVDFALITLVDRSRCWYKAEIGLGLPEMPREDNMCDVVLGQDGIYIVNDANAVGTDEVLPLRKMNFRFYAGAPLRTPSGIKIGTVCVVGKEPRLVTSAERTVLESLAELTVDALESRLKARQLELADEALRRANARLAEANRNQTAFIASMSHELRTPLNGILGASELLGQRLFGELTPKQAEYIGDIFQSGNHLLSLINDLLDLSRIEAGAVELEREWLDVACLVENAAVMVRGAAATRGVSVLLDPPPDSVHVYADDRRLIQVLCNLLSNAVKFTAPGTNVRIRARHEGGEVRFLVEDHGPGIAPQFQERIFERFVRLPGGPDGTGLGLPIARQLVELHGGTISLRSSLGEGSIFEFSIPAAPR